MLAGLLLALLSGVDVSRAMVRVNALALNMRRSCEEIGANWMKVELIQLLPGSNRLSRSRITQATSSPRANS